MDEENSENKFIWRKTVKQFASKIQIETNSFYVLFVSFAFFSFSFFLCILFIFLSFPSRHSLPWLLPECSLCWPSVSRINEWLVFVLTLTNSRPTFNQQRTRVDDIRSQFDEKKETKVGRSVKTVDFDWLTALTHVMVDTECSSFITVSTVWAKRRYCNTQDKDISPNKIKIKNSIL